MHEVMEFRRLVPLLLRSVPKYEIGVLVCFSADADDGFRQIHQNFLKELSRSTLILNLSRLL